MKIGSGDDNYDLYDGGDENVCDDGGTVEPY
jgi:hypothetical protein